jgi:DNA-directed RNA polymerase sigma subunit (sigma70/sigma32)
MKNLKLLQRDSRIKYLYSHCGLTLEEISKIYGLTREGVRQIILKSKYELDALQDKDLTKSN